MPHQGSKGATTQAVTYLFEDLALNHSFVSRINEPGISDLFKMIPELMSEVLGLKKELLVLKPRLKGATTQTEILKAELKASEDRGTQASVSPHPNPKRDNSFCREKDSKTKFVLSVPRKKILKGILKNVPIEVRNEFWCIIFPW